MIDSFLQNVGFYSGIVIAVVEIIKRAAGGYIPDRFYPLVSLVIGSCLGLFVLDWSFIQSLVIGLVASGVYKLTKDTVIEIKNRI